MLLVQSSLVIPLVKFPFQKCATPKFSSFPIKNRKFPSRIIQKNNARMPSVRCNTQFQDSYHNNELDQSVAEHDGGIGIMEFFKGKNILVTGTSAVGIAFVEKLLRLTEVGKIYLLVNEEYIEDPLHQIPKEARDPKLYTALSDKKLIPVVGHLFNFGMDSESKAIAKEVDVIVNSAGSSIKLNKIDHWLAANKDYPRLLMEYAKTSCKNLKLFVHISTAYVNVQPIVTYDEMMKGKDKFSQKRSLWCTSYLNTKALGEIFLNMVRKHVPLVIIRPTFIGSSYKEPFEGWMPKNSEMDALMINARKEGPKVALLVDLVPVDIVANVIIAAIARHGIKNSNEPDFNVYNVATGSTIERNETFPREECKQIEHEKTPEEDELFSLIDGFKGYIAAEFDTTNTQNLLEKMSEKEMLNFEVHGAKIDWRKYLDIPRLK